MTLLGDMARASVELYQQLAAIKGLEFSYQQNGLLVLFRSRREYEKGLKEAKVLQAIGIDSKPLTLSEVREMVPTVLSTVVGGVYFPGDAQLLPAEFVRGLARVVEKMGVKIYTSTEVLRFETARRRISTVRTTRGDFRPDEVVLASGAWSALLVRDLPIKLPIQAAKGYSVTVKRPQACPRIPLLFSEAKVAATPMAATLRLSGTLELAGLDLGVDWRRVNAVIGAIRNYLSSTEKLELIEIWRGLRPCTPDGLPIIERSNKFENLIFATGHGMIGMSLGPITGKLVSQLIASEAPTVDLTALSLKRFRLVS